MPTLYTVIRRPLITEKGLGVKETEGTLVFDVAPDATKTEVKQAVEALFKVKVAAVRTANVLGKERRRGKFSGLQAGLEEGVREAEGRRKAAGVREQPVRQLLAVAQASSLFSESRHEMPSSGDSEVG